jgi:hypothetical protein
MQKFFSDLLNKIIATMIIALGGSWLAYHWRYRWLPAIRSGISAVWQYLIAPLSVPHWLAGVFIVIAVLFVLLVVGLVVIVKTKNRAMPDWAYYISDTFYELKWVWGYEGREVRLKGVLCPRCDYQVGPDSASPFASSVRFHCDNCGRTVPVEGQSWDSLQSVVMRLIQQKLRNRTYPRTGHPSPV